MSPLRWRALRPKTQDWQSIASPSRGDTSRIAVYVLPLALGLLAASYCRSRAAISQREQQLEALVVARTQALHDAEQHAQKIHERRHRIAEGMNDIMAALNSNRPLAAVLTKIAFHCRDLLGAQSVTIGAMEADGDNWSVRAHCGATQAGMDQLSGELRDLIGSAIAMRQPVVMHGDAHRPASASGQPADRSQGPGILVAPIVVAAANFRGCVLLEYADQMQITQTETELAMLYAGQAALAIENTQLWATAQQIATVQERSRVARELHDSVTQSLYAIVLHADTALLALNAGKVEKTQEQMHQLKSIARTATSEVRLLIYALRPSSLEERGLEAALNERLEAVEIRSGITVDYQCALQQEVPPPVQDVVFQVILEGLNNVLKHAQATHIRLQVAAQDGWCCAILQDDGVGFDVDKAARYGGYGLQTIAERLELAGGVFTIASQPGAGSTLTFEVPL